MKGAPIKAVGCREQLWAGAEISAVSAGCRARCMCPPGKEGNLGKAALVCGSASQEWHRTELSASPRENALGLPERSSRWDSETRTWLKCVASVGEGAGIGKDERLLSRNLLDNR